MALDDTDRHFVDIRIVNLDNLYLIYILPAPAQLNNIAVRIKNILIRTRLLKRLQILEKWRWFVFPDKITAGRRISIKEPAIEYF